MRRLHGLSSRVIGVKEERDLLGESPDEPRVRLGKGGPHRRDGMTKARLVEGDHIEITLTDDDLALAARVEPAFKEAIEDLAFFINRALGAIDIFRRRIAPIAARLFGQGAATERDDAPMKIDDWEEQAMAE